MRGIDDALFDSKKGVKIDLGCGDRKVEGFIGIDARKLPGVDIVHNLEEFPWPVPDEVAWLTTASHLLEHINPANGIFLKFMDEVWRITKPGGQFAFTVPYAGSGGFWQDPTHVNGITERTIWYFDPLAGRPDSHRGELYRIYKPKPWKIIHNTWQVNGNLEVLLEKRIEDPSYYEPPKDAYDHGWAKNWAPK